jgi:hypothetical protein
MIENNKNRMNYFFSKKNLIKNELTFKENIYLESISGLDYPIVYRQKGKSKIISCPYCKKPHEHDESTLGHRVPPCSKYLPGLILIINKKTIPVDRGYIIKEYLENEKKNNH